MSKNHRPGLIVAAILIVVAGVWALIALGERDGEAGDDTAAVTSNPEDPREPRRPRVALDSTTELLRSDKASITGTVRDPEGQAIPGASVCAWPNTTALNGADHDGPRCTTSERDGHYRLDGLWPVATGVSASAPSFRPGRWAERRDGRRRYELRLGAGQERSGVDLILEPGGVAVRGVVKDISGGVIEGATVSATTGWWFGHAGRAVARTDENGRFELWTDPGDVSLRAEAEGYAEAETDAAAPSERAELFLTPESTIAGVVVHAETRAPIAGATVSARASGFFGRGGGVGLTDDDGRFRITRLPPGVYDLSATTDELYGEAAEHIHLGLAQSAELDVLVHPAFAIRGRVVIAETGEPCTEGSIHLDSETFDEYATIDDEGEVLIRAVLPGEYEVAVECRGYRSEPSYAPIVVADASIDGLEWQVHTGLAIRGVVVDHAGAEVEGVGVTAKFKPEPGEDPRGQRSSQWSSETEADGRFELSGLLSGSYELDVWSEDYPSLGEPVVVELGPGDLDDVRLVLPGTGALQGIVRDETGAAVPGITVAANLVDVWGSDSTKTGDDGRFGFERLRAGSYRVKAEIDWTTQMRAPGTTDDDVQGEVVEVREGGTAELELVVERSDGVIRGRVLDGDGGPVSDAFVEASRMSDSAAAGARRTHVTMRWGWDRQPVLSEQDGSFAISGLVDGSYLIRAYREGGGEALAEGVAIGSEVELTIVETGRIAGKVVLAGGGSPERFMVRIQDRSSGLERSDQFFRTSGAFVMRELPPGTYELTVEAREGAARLELELGAGEAVDDLRVELVAKITIKGRLVDADTHAGVPGYRVHVAQRRGTMIFTDDEGGGEHLDVSDADGRFEVRDVPSGKVQIWTVPRAFDEEGKYGWTRQVATLAPEPAVQDIGDLELQASRLAERQSAGDIGFKTKQTGPEVEDEDEYFEVAVIRPGGPADGSGLAIGDRILEVDGREVTGVDSYRYRQLIAAPPGTVIELTIEGGKTVAIELGPPLEW